MRHSFILFLFLPFFIQAQSEAGQKFITGYVRISKKKESSTNKAWGFYVAPSMGYMFSSRFAAGLSFNYSYGVSDRLLPSIGVIEVKERTKKYSLGLSPFVSWFKPLTDKIELSITSFIRLSANRLAATSIRNRSVSKGTSFSISIRPTFYYYLSKKIGIGITFGGLNYSKYKTTRAGVTQNTNIFSFYLRDAPFLGIRYIW